MVSVPIAAESPTSKTPQTSSENATTAGAKKRILVVDDNWDAADSLTKMLQLAGHEVHTAHDGQEAVEAAAGFRPDVVLLGTGLPKVNGYEAARHIRE